MLTMSIITLTIVGISSGNACTIPLTSSKSIVIPAFKIVGKFSVTNFINAGNITTKPCIIPIAPSNIVGNNESNNIGICGISVCVKLTNPSTILGAIFPILSIKISLKPIKASATSSIPPAPLKKLLVAAFNVLKLPANVLFSFS